MQSRVSDRGGAGPGRNSGPSRGRKGSLYVPEETNSPARPQRAGRGSGTAEARSPDRAAVLWGLPEARTGAQRAVPERC